MLKFQHTAKKTSSSWEKATVVKKRQIYELSRRERQIMEVIYTLGQGTAAEISERIPDAPSYSAVRALLRVLEGKGHLRHREQGPRYVWLPTVPRGQAMRQALRHVVRTFFDGKTESAVVELLEMESAKLTDKELERMKQMIRQAKREGR